MVAGVKKGKGGGLAASVTDRGTFAEGGVGVDDTRGLHVVRLVLVLPGESTYLSLRSSSRILTMHRRLRWVRYYVSRGRGEVSGGAYGMDGPVIWR